MTIKGIIFDMDGLMFNTELLGYEKMIEVTKDFNYEMPTYILDKTIGVNKKTAIVIYIPPFNIKKSSIFFADNVLTYKFMKNQ